MDNIEWHFVVAKENSVKVLGSVDQAIDYVMNGYDLLAASDDLTYTVKYAQDELERRRLHYGS